MKYFILIAIAVGIFAGVHLWGKLKTLGKPPETRPASSVSRPMPTPNVTVDVPRPGSPTPAPSPTPSPTPRITREVQLQHSNASSVASVVGPAGIANLSVLPTAGNSSVFIIGTSLDDVEAAEEAVRAFDDAQRLITVYALVGRYTQSKGHEIGLFDYIAQSARNGSPDVAAMLSSVALDLTTGVATLGGTVTARMVLEVMSQFSSSTGRFRVESRPTITTISGQKAEFATGQEIPVSTTVNSQMTTQTSVTYKTAEFKLVVTPTLRADGSVRLQLEQQNAEVIGSVVVDGNQVPTIATQKAQTVVDLRPRQLLYLGGIRNVVDEKSQKGVPGIGRVFPFSLIAGRSTGRQERGELVIILAVEVQDAGKNLEGIYDRDFTADPDGLIAAPKSNKFRGVDARKPANAQSVPANKSTKKSK